MKTILLVGESSQQKKSNQIKKLAVFGNLLKIVKVLKKIIEIAKLTTFSVIESIARFNYEK